MFRHAQDVEQQGYPLPFLRSFFRGPGNQWGSVMSSGQGKDVIEPEAQKCQKMVPSQRVALMRFLDFHLEYSSTYTCVNIQAGVPLETMPAVETQRFGPHLPCCALLYVRPPLSLLLLRAFAADRFEVQQFAHEYAWAPAVVEQKSAITMYEDFFSHNSRPQADSGRAYRILASGSQTSEVIIAIPRSST